jgi:hypothetical protein
VNSKRILTDSAISGVLWISSWVVVLLAAASVVLRYRRSAGEERLPVRGSVGVAVSVLAAAALFNPLRSRVQAAVDRRFERARYDAERVVTQFSVQLRDQVDIDALGEGLLGVVEQVLAPAHLSLWLREPGPFG